MKVVILAGGKGTRISEETKAIPKPMLMVGDRPIIHHIMDIYRKYGCDDFVIAAGYKSGYIHAYYLGLTPKDIHFNGGWTQYDFDEFRVKVVNTGEETMTGGRLKRLAPFLDDTFLMTYGDGLANVNISCLVANHSVSQALVTLTAVHPVPRFGSMKFDLYGEVSEFSEKPMDGESWINGGFFVIEPKALDFIKGDSTNWEKDVLPILVSQKRLYAFVHLGFWQCVDTLRDLEHIQEIYQKEGPIWLT